MGAQHLLTGVCAYSFLLGSVLFCCDAVVHEMAKTGADGPWVMRQQLLADYYVGGN
jgi:hypothetical protein